MNINHKLEEARKQLEYYSIMSNRPKVWQDNPALYAKFVEVSLKQMENLKQQEKYENTPSQSLKPFAIATWS